jgi:hypothetical protein
LSKAKIKEKPVAIPEEFRKLADKRADVGISIKHTVAVALKCALKHRNEWDLTHPGYKSTN